MKSIPSSLLGKMVTNGGLGLLGVVLTLLFLVSNPAHATLINNGGGLIYDTDLDITWLQDARYSRTSGAGNVMDWTTANNWAMTLSFNGFTGWRLPTTTQPDSSCFAQIDPGGGFPVQGFGILCSGSELGHLYYTELGNLCCGAFGNVGPFINLEAFAYWSSTEYAPSPDLAWFFNVDQGLQQVASKTGSTLIPWAVHDGNLVPSVEPGTLLLIGVGLIAVRKRVSPESRN